MRGKSLSLSDWTVAHDYLFHDGGAELVTRHIGRDLLPGSDLLYLAGSSILANSMTDGRQRRLLPLNLSEKSYRYLVPAMPALVAAQPPIDGNLLASSYAFVGGLRAVGKKVIYCHSPLRQIWSGRTSYASTGPLLERSAVLAFGPLLRRFDVQAARSADLLVSTSRAVQARAERYYGIQSPIVAPPFDDDLFFYSEGPKRDFVWTGRITEPYKRLSLVIEAFRSLPDRVLTVVGDGRDRERLERLSPANVRFVGWLPREAIARVYQEASAVIFSSEDDFGIVPVEAMATGTPVIALGRGGAVDTVLEGETGIFFNEPTAAAVLAAVRRFDQHSWDHGDVAAITRRRFGRERFLAEMKELI